MKLPALVLAVLCAGSAAAQVSFYADLDGTKETPANASTCPSETAHHRCTRATTS